MDWKICIFLLCCLDSTFWVIEIESKKVSYNGRDFDLMMRSKQMINKLHVMFYSDSGYARLEKLLDLPESSMAVVNFEDEVLDLSKKLNAKIGNGIYVLLQTARKIEDLHSASPYNAAVINHYDECCSMSERNLMHSNRFKTSVNFSRTCDIVPQTLNGPFLFYPTKNLTYAFRLASKIRPDVKWQYFISSDGLQVEYPAHNFDPNNFSNCLRLSDQRHKDIFLKTILPQPKSVVILIELSSSGKPRQMLTAVKVAKSLLYSLSDSDFVTVLGIGSNVVVYPKISGCGDQVTGLLAISMTVKVHLARFLDKLASSEVPGCFTTIAGRKVCSSNTNHSLAFAKSFKVLSGFLNSQRGPGTQPYIFYISTGIVSMRDQNPTIDLIIAQNKLLNYSVVINTFFIYDHIKQALLGHQFLTNVAAQKQPFDDNATQLAPPGNMILIESDFTSLNVSTLVRCFQVNNMTAVFNETNSKSPKRSMVANDVHVSLPKYDEVSRDMVVSFSIMVEAKFDPDRVVGVVGLDFGLTDLMESIIYYEPLLPNSYPFVIDLLGNTVFHPEFGMSHARTPHSVDISLLEKVANFSRIRSAMLTQRSGSMSLNGFVYVWKRVQVAPYVVAIRSTQASASVKKFDSANPKQLTDQHITHNNMDISNNDHVRRHLCLQYEQLRNLHYTSLFLSGKIFLNPLNALIPCKRQCEFLKSDIQMLYLEDSSKLLSTPGIKPHIREELSTIADISKEWQRLAKFSMHSSSILRRYYASNSGFQLTYPGIVFHKRTDPTSKAWFRGAMNNPGKMFFSKPRLDTTGAGYIVSISKVLTEGPIKVNGSSMHDSNRPIGVVGIDVPVLFLHKLLLTKGAFQECNVYNSKPSERNVSCYLFDAEGYVVAHPPGLMTTDLPTELHHIVFREQRVITHLLSNPKAKQLVRKRACRRYMDGTIQRSYSFNMSIEPFFFNGETEDKCYRYQFTYLNKTNIFVGIVHKQECKPRIGQIVCACSRVDRRCMNCNRMEPNECECPCQCPIHDFHTCAAIRLSGRIGRGEISPFLNSSDVCEVPEQVELERPVGMEFRSLPKCLRSVCPECNSEEKCVGRAGYEWCQFKDNKSMFSLTRPFCGMATECFAGILGLSPYPPKPVLAMDEGFIASTPVGPVAGGIMAVFVVLVVGVYCYRHQVSRLADGETQYTVCVGHRSGSEMRLNASKDVDEMEESFDEPPGPSNGTGAAAGPQLASFERENMNVMARYPPRIIYPRLRDTQTESSDHGYSTMSPNNGDDSEHATVIEPLVRQKIKQNEPDQHPLRIKLIDIDIDPDTIDSAASDVSSVKESDRESGLVKKLGLQQISPIIKLSLSNNEQPLPNRHSSNTTYVPTVTGQTMILPSNSENAILTAAQIHCAD